MTDHPILFSAPMVRALLDGRKTQTRRILSFNNTLFNGDSWHKGQKAQTWDWEKAWVDPGPSPVGNLGPYLKLPWLSGDQDPWKDTVHRIYPIVQPGDVLWVRETFSFARKWQGTKPSEVPAGEPVWYWADGNPPDGDWTKPIVSIHMPRWASRLTLTVTDVRVERLNSISDADAIAEGVRQMRDGGGTWVGREGPGNLVTPWPTASEAYSDLWDAINGYSAWDANPWVIAQTFTVDRRNIDEATR